MAKKLQPYQRRRIIRDVLCGVFRTTKYFVDFADLMDMA